MRMALLSIGLVIFIHSGSRNAFALPEFPIRYGLDIYGEGHDHQHDGGSKTMDCRACHINPTGGGMRNDHGRQFALEMLSLAPSEAKKEMEGHGHGGHNDHQEKKEDGNGLVLNRALSFGGDFRFAYLHAQSESSSAYKNSFFPMQADIYLLFHPHPRVSLYYQDGLRGWREHQHKY